MQVLLLLMLVRQRNQIKRLSEQNAKAEDAVRKLEQTMQTFSENYCLLSQEEENADTSLHDAVIDEGEDITTDDQFRNKVMSLVVANYADPSYSPSQLIDGMFMSRSLFNRKSTALLGQSAGRLINSFRMEKAKELILSNHDMNISDVAYAVGFNDPKYFTRYFTKFYGCSPTKMTGKPQ